MEETLLGFPYIDPDVYVTNDGTRYLQMPGVAMLAQPKVDISGLVGFLNGFPEGLHFSDYLDDPVILTDAETLVKTSGQLCYLALGTDRTWNKDADRYLGNIKDQKHGSIMEHVNFTFALWGVSRSFTHEIVRHRAGCGFSQVSQRYVGKETLRFVERPEFVADMILHEFFVKKIIDCRKEYEWLTNYLVKKQADGEEILSAERKTDLKKKVRQCSRAILPNMTEAPIIVTANARAWRNILEQRVSEHAEVEIRRVVYNIFLCLKPFLPNILSDYKTVELVDGTVALASPYSKV